MHKIAIFASGAGTNAENIIRYFKNHKAVQISLVVSNKPQAGVLQVAGQAQIPTIVIEKDKFLRGDAYLPELTAAEIDFIVLAGFLWKIPDLLIRHYPGRMVNIHPALLPMYGGKGMYGKFVHEAVINAGDAKSGISIHLVDEEYDHGKTIFQATCPVDTMDTPETLAAKIHELEYLHYPVVLERLLDAGEAHEKQ